MLPSAEQQGSHRVSDRNKNKNLNRVSSSTSSPSSSTSSSSLPTNSQTQNKHPTTMEEVWKDITLSSLHHHQNPHDPRLGSHQAHDPNSIFQDFLNRPLNQEPPASLSMGSSSNGDTSTAIALYGSPLPAPATVLSLNSSAAFELLDNSDSHLLQNHPQLSSNVSSFTTPFEALASAGRFGCYEKKRGQDSDGSSSDIRHKRMIKNRESAARSRARKQECPSPLSLTPTSFLYDLRWGTNEVFLHLRSFCICGFRVLCFYRLIRMSWSLKLLTCRQKMQDSRENNIRGWRQHPSFPKRTSFRGPQQLHFEKKKKSTSPSLFWCLNVFLMERKKGKFVPFF
ncbi:PREDICTED: protein FD-like isoform X2 [Tarenaya hassleriana]|uniref:protein FD-like isoform X2 n=1 Tax=Tarenaya hassleriana TaxID=28532 RepID=UPI00053C08A7|nr:PREDICTED: protein FD-like isoform X2 [Tarenaya hassleriana]